ncbi:MAG: ankyrin repeat protein [Halioglobus sp.]|jgi:ankyrin repeat protein
MTFSLNSCLYPQTIQNEFSSSDLNTLDSSGRTRKLDSLDELVPQKTLEKARLLAKKIFPLSKPHIDRSNRKIQLWAVPNKGLVATVIDADGKMDLVFSDRIYNGIQPNEIDSSLLKKLSGYPARDWDLVYLDKKVFVWPHLKAAARDGNAPPEGVNRYDLHLNVSNLSNEGKNNVRIVREWAISKGYFLQPGRNSGPEVWGKNNPNNGRFEWYLKIKPVGARNTGLMGDSYLPRIECRRTPGPNGKPSLYLNPYTSSTGGRHVGGHIPLEPNHNRQQQLQLARRQFVELLQHTRLTSSYNSSNPNAQVPPKGPSGGQIGGVGNSVGIISGLFDSIETMFEGEHRFQVPAVSGGKVPFTQPELQQIFRELAIGIYAHDSVPFFSLHFNGDANMYPVIHPAYENTLVGRVIGMLDYYMKGFLNGCYFDEEFVQKWKGERVSSDSLGASKLQDLRDYCKEHLGDDSQYLSVRELIERNEQGSSSGSSVFNDYSGFRSSFRIIAKQNSIQKVENLFAIDSDFDVFYDIEPDAAYSEELRRYQSLHGKNPQGYQNLEKSYKYMQKQIKEVMPKLPMCEDLFAMLGVINFFSYYFKTLKENNKLPVLQALELEKNYTFPSQFPSLPIKKTKTERLSYTAGDIFAALPNELKDSFKENLRNYGTIEDPEQSSWKLLRAAGGLSTWYSGRERITTETVARELSRVVKKVVKEKVSPSIWISLQESDARGIWSSLEREAKSVSKTLREFLEQGQWESREKKDKKSEFKFLDDVLAEITFQFSLRRNVVEASSETSASHRDAHVKVVGGCGLKLLNQKVKSLIKSEVFEESYPELSSVDYETWVPVKTEAQSTPSAYVFKLDIMDDDTPSSGDYSWMKGALNRPEYSFSELTVEFRDAIVQEDMRIFNELSWDRKVIKERDGEGASLVHFAAAAENPLFLSELFSKGASKDPQDELGFSPLHYAAVHGRLDNIDLLLRKKRTLLNQASKNGSTPLYVAIRHKKIEAVKRLIAKGADVNKGISSDMTPLYAALHHGHTDIALELLKSDGIDLDAKTEEGSTALYIAAELNYPEVVEKLLEKGANPNICRKDGFGPIHIATKFEHVEVCEKLLRNRSTNPRLPLKSGNTALHLAVEAGNFQLSRMLGRRKSDIEAKGLGGNTAMMLAVKNCDVALAKLFFEKTQNDSLGAIVSGSALSSSGYYSRAPGIKLQNLKKQLDSTNDKGETPLLVAASLGLTEIVDMAIPSIKDVIQEDQSYPSWRERYLSGVANRLFTSTPNKLLLRLCQHGDAAYVRKVVSTLDFSQDELKEALSVAARHGKMSVVQMLMRQGVEANFTGSGGWNLAHFAAKHDSKALLMKLAQSTDDLYGIRLDNGKTLAYIAAENGSGKVLDFLLKDMDKKGIPLTNQFGDKHLLYGAVHQGHLDAVKAIVKYMTPDSVLSGDGSYASHIAAKNGDVEMMDLLLSRGVRFDHKDENDCTPLHLAIKYGREEALPFLLNKVKNMPVAEDAVRYASSVGNTEAVTALVEYGLEADLSEEIASGSPASLNELSPENAVKLTKLLQALKGGEQDDFFDVLEDFPLNTEVKYSINGEEQENPLLFAVYGYSDTPGSGEIFSRFVQRDDVDVNVRDNDGNTLAMIMASEGDDFGEIPGVDLTLKNKAGSGVLHYLAGSNKNITEAVLSQFNDLEDTDDAGNTPLIYAIQAKNFHNVQKLVEKGANLFHENNDLHTPLSAAVSVEFATAVTYLLEQGADVNHPVGIRRTPCLNLALSKGADEIAHLLLIHGADVRKEDSKGVHAVHIAAEEGNLSFLRMLLRKGQGRVLDHRGQNPAHYAAMTTEENSKALQVLHGNGTGMDVPTRQKARPSHLSALKGNAGNLRSLLLLGADPEVVDANGKGLIYYGVQSSCRELLDYFTKLRVSEKEKHLKDAIGAAIAMDYLDHVSILYGLGIPIGDEIVGGLSGLQISSKYGATKSARFLLEEGADAIATNFMGVTAVEMSAVEESVEHLRLFCLHGDSDIDRKYAKGKTLLHLSVEAGRLLNTALLIELSASLDQVDDSRDTALHLAARRGDAKMLRLLMACGADFNKKTADGKTPAELIRSPKTREMVQQYEELWVDSLNTGDDCLHIAVRAVNAEVLPLLLRVNDVDKKNSSGETALHLATRSWNFKIMRHLFNGDADINAQDNDERTPLYIAAVELEDEKLTKFLLKMHANCTIKVKGERVVEALEAKDSTDQIETIITMLRG